MAKKISIMGTITPPTMMNAVPDVGGSTKFDMTPGGGVAMGNIARTESGILARDMIDN